ncbi:MAG: fructosamine kinase family protein [Planctomycetota bacterium]|nr:fructosamine kinase family protein [Planctomycetota bacterium]MEC8511523.1 fructosamine kinase family protein [Planctomycetota bacterium]
MTDRARAALEAALAPRRFRAAHLAAGRTGEVLRVEVEGGPAFVAKLDPRGDGGLETEADGLRLLAAAGAPAPRVESAGPHLLLMDWCSGETGVAPDAAEDAARALYELHAAGEMPFGLATDARIGGLDQPNTPRDSWLAFFSEHRLVAFARAARDEGRLDAHGAQLVERVAARLADLAAEPASPALLHGDLWAGNVLTGGGALTAFLDPAPYHGHREVDLAFATMFGGFPRRFFDVYRERASSDEPGVLDREFWSDRRDLWNLFPLLVHVRLFGGSYAQELVRTARRFA